MHTIFCLIPEWLQPENLLIFGGLSLLLLVVFAENGLFFGFFLPGDSLLFTAGILCGTPYLPWTITLLLAALIVAASLGSWTGYWFGRKAGKWLRNRPDGVIFKKKYLLITESYYHRKGPLAFVLGRFLPIIRTFVPILAGIVHMKQSRFMLLNVLGVAIWVVLVTGAGYFLGQSFPWLIHHLEWIALGMIVISFIPVLYTWFAKPVRHE